MRLLMGPVVAVTAESHGRSLNRAFGTRVRWVTDNGWTGGCGPECWHGTAEAAHDCFWRPRP